MPSRYPDRMFHRERTVKNAIVDTADVNIECGSDFVNWVPIARRKLGVNYL